MDSTDRLENVNFAGPSDGQARTGMPPTAAAEPPRPPAQATTTAAAATPAQRLIWRLVALRNRLARTADQLEEVSSSIDGSAVEPPRMAGNAPKRVRRFFPAIEYLIGQIESEAARLAEQSSALDGAFDLTIEANDQA